MASDPIEAVTLLTTQQAAARAQVSERTIRRRIKEGRLVAIPYGSGKRPTWRIDPAALVSVAPADQDASTPPPPSRHGRRPQSPSSRSQILGPLV
jgi:excisionase family DNA binding protein